MTRGALLRMAALMFVLGFVLIVGASVAYAADDACAGDDCGTGGVSNKPPIPVVGPRLTPPAIPHTSVLNTYTIYNAAPKPCQLCEAAAWYKNQPYYKSGAGILPTVTNLGNGVHLNPTPVACNTFNATDLWAAKRAKSDVWTDSYAGWLPFAVDDGYRQAKNTTFSMERVVGPGNNYGKGYSVKIAGNQPYAGGFGSPIIKAPPGANVTVTVKYLIWDYIQAVDPGQKVKDWASMGVKPDAYGEEAVYVNGYHRGEWAELSNTFVVGPSGQVMVLLQGESFGAVNSNIYFDDVTISVNGEYLKDCSFE